MTATVMPPPRPPSGPGLAQPSAAGNGSVTRYRLLRQPSGSAPIVPSAEQRTVIDHPGGRLRVLAGPGTGKTATIVEAVADRILRRGMDPASILVLTFSRRAAADLSQRIAARLDVTVTEPLVRTLHSYAYALLRSAALAAGDPPPRLLDAGQADLMVREILAGHADDGGGPWPAHLRAALRVPAFAAELREFMLRAAEREIMPRQIAELGRRARRPEWRAAAAFISEYRDIGDLRQAANRFGAALDQAELTVAALDRLAEPAVLAGQQERIRRIFVDEYQDVDPAQARMIETLASGAEELIVVGDPDQSIYGFRGADTGAMQHVSADRTAVLTASRRMAPVLLAATRRVARRLPGPAAHRALRPSTAGGTGSLDVRVLSSAAREAAYIADQFRRAHLEHGIAWSRMAVLLRSPATSADPIRRAFSSAGVPLLVGVAGPLAADPLVGALLSVLRAGTDPGGLTASVALDLLSSPLGGMDPTALRQLRRAVRAHPAAALRPVAGSDPPASSADLLAAIMIGKGELPPGLPPPLERPLRRLTELVALARAGAGDPAAEDVLWRVWQHSGLAERLLAASEHGGRDASNADSMLDAAVALFDRAAELADQLPGAGVATLLELVGGEQIASSAQRGIGTEAVPILSAHAAKGLEWDVVAVAGVQQDTWPDLRPRASLLGVAELLDASDGIRQPGGTADRLADERRLFYVAATRARHQLVVTAVQDEEKAPSRFLTELAGTDTLPTGWPKGSRGTLRRALHLPALVADLRRNVISPAPQDAPGVESEAECAAQALARLAAAGVIGAHPDTWHGLAPPSTEVPLVAAGAEVVLSPSQVESLMNCPLRAVLERHGARGAPGQGQLLGIAVHALAQGMADGATGADLDAATEEFLAGQDHLPPWEVARLRRMLETMTQALRVWVETSGDDRIFAGSEVPLDVRLPPVGACSETPSPVRTSSAAPLEEHPVRLVGRVDWLSTDDRGRTVVTDFKSGATPPTKAAVREHAQLAVYQVAAALGAFDRSEGQHGAWGDRDPDGNGNPGGDEDSDAADPPQRGPELGGAELVYLRSGRPKTLQQPPQDAADRERWLERLRDVAREMAGSTVTARQGEVCERCPVRSSCPVQPEGRQVTQ